jgi:hypothetical protein
VVAQSPIVIGHNIIGIEPESLGVIGNRAVVVV